MNKRQITQWSARPLTIIFLLLAGLTLLTLLASDRFVVGLAAVALMLSLIFIKVHVGYALVGPGLLGLYSLYGSPAVINVLKAAPFDVISNWEFSVIPTFILMGLMLWRSGATSKIYDICLKYVSWLPGGAAVATVIAGTGLAATSGSTVGSVHALSRIAMPEMLKAGYDKVLASGTVMMTGLIGQLIPPSVFLVIYAGIAEVPVGPQLLAGIGPGVALAVAYCVTIILFVLLKRKSTLNAHVSHGSADENHDSPTNSVNSSGKNAPETFQEEKTGSSVRLIDSWPIVVVAVVIIGGIYTGFFTATEAGAAAAVISILILFILKKDINTSFKSLFAGARETVVSTGGIFLILIGSTVFNRLLAVSGLSRALGDWLGSGAMGQVTFLVTLALIYIVLGMFMDPLSILLLTVPLLIPAVDAYGIEPVWFGVYAVLLAELSIVTPPVGVLAFIFHKIVKNPVVNQGISISLSDVFKGAILFIPSVLLVLVVMILIPGIATFLL